MTTTKRARSEAAKQKRREALLNAADSLVEAAPLADVTMAKIAKAAALAKGTCYLYFDTKEELLLALLQRHLGEWFDALESRLSQGRARVSPQTLQGWLAMAFDGRAQLVTLMAELRSLEDNIGATAARAHKRWLWTRMKHVGGLLEARFGGLGAGDGFRLLMHLQALTAGIGQVTRPNAVMEAVLEEDDSLGEFRRDFTEELAFAVNALLRGVSSPQRRAQTRHPK